MMKTWFETHRSLLFALTLAASGCMDAAEADMGGDPTADVQAKPTDSVEAAAVQPCSVRSNGKLYCTNKYKAPIYPWPDYWDPAIDKLHTTYSWFDCWEYGELHPGNNYTWYHTQGDEHGYWGYVPAVHLSTSSAFDANPSAHGLPYCN